ncbi:MAG: periplasmic heavy metal sensor [Sulfitobacter sp.]
MQEQGGPRRPGARRFRVVLALSLALNLLLIGVFAGAIWRNAGGPGGHGRFAPPGMQSYAAPYVRALPRADQRTLRRALRAEKPRPSRAERQADYNRMLAALRADPFDPAAVRSVLTGQKTDVLALQEAAQEQWLRAVEGMDSQGRAAYADRLEEELKRGPRRGDRKRRETD